MQKKMCTKFSQCLFQQAKSWKLYKAISWIVSIFSQRHIEYIAQLIFFNYSVSYLILKVYVQYIFTFLVILEQFWKSTSENRKNVFYFTSQNFLVPEMFKF